MKVNDALHAKYVEDTLPRWVMTTFVTESRDDYNTLLNGLKAESENIRASVYNIEGGYCKPFKRPYSDEQMARFQTQYGISGFLDEVC